MFTDIADKEVGIHLSHFMFLLCQWIDKTKPVNLYLELFIRRIENKHIFNRAFCTSLIGM